MQPSSIDIYHALCTYPPRCTRQEPKRQSPTHPIQRQISKSCLFYVCISHVSPFSVSLCRSHSLSLFLSQLWRPSEAKEKGPKKPSKTKKDHPNPGQVKRGPRKAGEVGQFSQNHIQPRERPLRKVARPKTKRQDSVRLESPLTARQGHTGPS